MLREDLMKSLLTVESIVPGSAPLGNREATIWQYSKVT